MKLRSRFFLLFLSVAVLVLVPGVSGIRRLGEMEEIVRTQRVRYAAGQRALGVIIAALADLRRHADTYVALADAETGRAMFLSLSQARASLLRLQSLGFPIQPTEQRLDRLAVALEHTRRLIEEDRLQEATEFLNTRVGDEWMRTEAELLRMDLAIERANAAAVARAEHIGTRGRMELIGMLVAALFGAVLLAVYAGRSIVAPLRRLRADATRVAEGRLESSPSPAERRGDEIGDLARSFRFMTQELARLEEVRSGFMAALGHDLKNPLGAILSYAELARAGIYGSIPPRVDRTYEAIQNAANDVLSRLEDLQNLGRLGYQGIQPQMSDIETAALLDTVERTFAPVLQRKQVAFVVEREPSTPELFRGDLAHLRDEVIGNLMGNAAKFTPPGGRVTLRSAGEDRHLVVEVRDTGPGIAADDLPHIFQPNFRGRKEGSDPGAGLGLAIAQRVVDLHEGHISVESTPGRGTTFRVRIPAVQYGETRRGRVDSPPSASERGIEPESTQALPITDRERP